MRLWEPMSSFTVMPLSEMSGSEQRYTTIHFSPSGRRRWAEEGGGREVKGEKAATLVAIRRARGKEEREWRGERATEGGGDVSGQGRAAWPTFLPSFLPSLYPRLRARSSPGFTAFPPYSPLLLPFPPLTWLDGSLFPHAYSPKKLSAPFLFPKHASSFPSQRRPIQLGFE